MKRLWRWLFILAAGVSLVLCAGLIVLWVRSYVVADRWFYMYYYDSMSASHRVQNELQSGSGGIGYYRSIHSYFELWNGWQELHANDARFMTNVAASSGSDYYYLREKRAPSYPDFKMRSNDAPWLGFKFGTLIMNLNSPRSTESVQVIVPYWSIIVIFSILPFCRFLKWQRTRRRSIAGACVVCGYDLRATPERCPECGAVPEAAKGAVS